MVPYAFSHSESFLFCYSDTLLLRDLDSESIEVTDPILGFTAFIDSPWLNESSISLLVIQDLLLVPFSW